MLKKYSHSNHAPAIIRVMALDDPNNSLAIEIQQETAATYFAACRKMVDSLAALETFDIAGAASIPDHERIKRRSELLEDAIERVYFVVIQREAMQLCGSERFFQDYGVPDEVRALLGRRRGESSLTDGGADVPVFAFVGHSRPLL